MIKFTEQDVKDRCARAYIPQHMRKGIINYLVHGIDPGDFLRAVFSNNLTLSFAFADIDNKVNMYQYVRLLCSLPTGCYGSWRMVKDWIEAHKQAREQPDPD